MIFFIYARTVHFCIYTIKLCHDFAINYREIDCLTISNYYPVKLLAKIQIHRYIRYPDGQNIDIRTNVSNHYVLQKNYV